VRQLATDTTIGANWIQSERLRKALDLGDDLESLLRVIQLHPAFPPGYAPFDLEVLDPQRARITFDSKGPAFAEGDGCSLFALLETGEDEPLAALARGVNPRARAESVGPLAWDIVIDPSAEPVPEPDPVAIGRVGSVAGFVFMRRKPIRA
jgi:hypothetical protein